MSKRILTPALILLTLAACSDSASDRSPELKEKNYAQSSMQLEEDGSSINRQYKKEKSGFARFISSSAALLNPGDSLHRFVRSADLRFKVNKVVDATYEIEDFTARHSGYVAYTNLISTVNQKSEIQLSSDSILKVTDFTVSNTMTLRVPYQKMDTLLKDIATTITYLDYRTIKARDVSLDELANQLTQLRTERMQQRIGNSISSSNGDATDKTTAAEAMERQEAAADQALIDNKRLEDKMRYATIKLELYQENDQLYQQVASKPPVEEYKPGMGTRLADAFHTGWELLLEFILLLARIWVLLLLGLAAYVWYRRRRKNRQTAPAKNETVA